MLYKNISNRTIRVRNIILKPNEQAEFASDQSHVKTFLRMNWLVQVEAPAKAAKLETPVVVEEVKPVVVAEPDVVPEPEVEPKVVPVEEKTFENDPAPDHPYPTPEVVPVVDAPVVAEETKHGRGRGKGK